MGLFQGIQVWFMILQSCLPCLSTMGMEADKIVLGVFGVVTERAGIVVLVLPYAVNRQSTESLALASYPPTNISLTT